MNHCELVAPDVYMIPVPLPANPLRVLNSYVITSGKRPIVVDLGFDREECSTVLAAGLAELGYTFADVDLFFTHAHPDHIGAINRVWHPGARVYAGFASFDRLRCDYHARSRGFRRWLNDDYELLPAEQTTPQLSLMEAKKALANEYDYSDMGDIVVPQSVAPITLLKDGDTLDAGNRMFTVIGVRGHDPYHLCLFDPADGILIAGDQVLKTITPNLVSFALGENILNDYLVSLSYLNAFPVRLVLPGHRDRYEDLHGRIAELQAHHRKRSTEIIDIMHAEKKTLKDIVRLVGWKSPISCWDDWPEKQKYFSLGETLVHLTYLEQAGLIGHDVSKKKIQFFVL